jgi:hypothetical protein
MEPKKKLPLSLNGSIPRNLFPKTLSFKENRKFNSKERQKKENEAKVIPKPKKPFIYYHKITKMENKKESFSMPKSKISIDSKTDVRLPIGYIDLSYDNPKNE